jgi:hypothetical protein
VKSAIVSRVLAPVVVTLLTLMGANGQGYTVDWYTVDGGGGTSANGLYTVTGTIGQPDAGAMTDGYYRVDSGFWSLIAPGAPLGAPVLTITLAGGNVIVEWPVEFSGFGLQGNGVLGTANWVYLTNAPTEADGRWQIALPATGKQFYRLAAHPGTDTISMSVTAGAIIAPFVITNGVLYQPVETLTPSAGGRAAFSFTLGNPGAYIIKTIVNAMDGGANSLFVNIDAEPQDPYMIWDIPITSGFESQKVDWRGNGTFGNDQFVPNVFGLAAGAHQIIIRGREAYTLLQTITVMPYP